MYLLTRFNTVCAPVVRVLEWLQPAFMLAVRLYVASVFFKSGLTKIASMDSTIMLFTYEYQVPLLSPTLAAYLGTAADCPSLNGVTNTVLPFRRVRPAHQTHGLTKPSVRRAHPTRRSLPEY